MAKLYGDRDPRALDRAGSFFSRHMAHMTSENLVGKGEIAMELAHRDMEIRNLKIQVAIYEDTLEALSRLGNGDTPGNSVGNEMAQRALEQAKKVASHGLINQPL